MPHGPSDEVNPPQVQYQDMYACTTSMSASTGGQGRAGKGRAGQGRAGQGIMQAHIHVQGKQYNKRLKAANMTGETGKHTCIDLQDAHASASCRAGG